MTLSNPSDNAMLDPAASSAKGMITDNESPSLSVAVGSTAEGDSCGYHGDAVGG